MLYVLERRREISDGGIELLIDPAALRRMLSDHQYSHGRIKKLLTDLRAATVEIVTPEMESSGDSIIGGLIDHVIPSPMTRRDPLTGGERHLWRVGLGIALVLLLERDLSLYYPPVPPLPGCNTGSARRLHGMYSPTDTTPPEAGTGPRISPARTRPPLKCQHQWRGGGGLQDRRDAIIERKTG
jgi:hypothetical protein